MEGARGVAARRRARGPLALGPPAVWRRGAPWLPALAEHAGLQQPAARHGRADGAPCVALCAGRPCSGSGVAQAADYPWQAHGGVRKARRTRAQVFATPTARTIDVATVLVQGRGALAIVSPETREVLLQRLQKHIFPMDEVTITDVTAHTRCRPDRRVPTLFN